MNNPSDAVGAALRAARADAQAQVAALTLDLRGVIDASLDSNADDEHDPEGATIAFERAQVAALLAGAHRRVAELDEALARLADGSYGRCERCGQPIPAERLAVRPSARTCVGCAR
ncbi:TraR/DksA family transcriptional regulator [Micromonospora mirobrigensis]|uniref:Transcriptional regulator, TraR/DksA family n=1 Tax=Micromonospora mirobrigensis TaxID=262898 RepID=A0A1C4WU75_9ACTN|nr:TraR/DksA C4-type zinc finger protein [Micromonospora mirobrigensis]SCE99797.1 transcriptional regulator, TraR/DksA family [Micromonospora mirobrigensis]